MKKVQAPRSQPLIAVKDVPASSTWYAKILNVTPHSKTHKETHGNSYNRLLKGKKIILQLHGWDVDDHPNMTNRDKAPVGHGIVLWFEVDDFDEAVSRAREIQAEIITEPSKNPFVLHYELWLRDPDGYIVGIASQPENG